MTHTGYLRREDLHEGWYWARLFGNLECVRVVNNDGTMIVNFVEDTETVLVATMSEESLRFIQWIQEPKEDVG